MTHSNDSSSWQTKLFKEFFGKIMIDLRTVALFIRVDKTFRKLGSELFKTRAVLICYWRELKKITRGHYSVMDLKK